MKAMGLYSEFYNHTQIQLDSWRYAAINCTARFSLPRSHKAIHYSQTAIEPVRQLLIHQDRYRTTQTAIEPHRQLYNHTAIEPLRQL